ncbi:MAG: RHS repeat protein, partial [Deltaproteobacteria bacterium]|nr:RHS repeat protein [Deltaproteobacteria bacterium]
MEERDVLSDTEAYITTFTYDQAGNLASKTDKEANTTYYQYDGLNRLIKVIDPLGQETQYTYDDRDNLIQLTDARGNTTHFEYDRNNRLVKEIRPMGEETTYQYDGVGNLIQKTDAKNQKTGYLYDDAGRLVEIKYYGTDDHVNPVKTVRFTYDRVGNLKTYDDGTTSARYGYDDAYRKISESVYYGAFTLSYAYTYYKNGLKETFTGPDNVTYTYSYDGNNQLTGVEIPGKGFITYTSYTWNRPAAITLPGGSTKGYTYDPLMRVKEITAKDPAQNILMTFRYDYDKVDNILNKDTEHGNYEYQYDDLYRLTSADNPVLADEIYTYDPVGNRLISADFPGEWSYNQNNELLGYDGIAFVYDDNGNMVRKTENGRVTNYVYNLEDRLERVEDGSGSLIAQYYYDPFGR